MTGESKPLTVSVQTVGAALRREETRALLAVQSLVGNATVVAGARAMSHFGEHAGGWLLIGATAAVSSQGRRRREWLRATSSVFVAHAAAVIVKRIIRRPRPSDARVRVLAKTPSRLSFPSAHVSSTTAAALSYGRLLGPAQRAFLLPMVVLPMGVSRVVLGVHFPTDVAAAAALGWVVARWHRRDRRETVIE